MPLSTCTTRSPTFRSRKSDTNERVAERRRSAARRSSSKRSDLGEDEQAAVRQMEPARELPDGDQDGGVLRGRRRRRPTARGRRSRRAVRSTRSARPDDAATKRTWSPRVTRRSDLLDPIADPPVILERPGRHETCVAAVGSPLNRQLGRAGVPRSTQAWSRVPPDGDRVERRHGPAAREQIRRAACATALPASRRDPARRLVRARPATRRRAAT